jgi:hypothetical protein
VADVTDADEPDGVPVARNVYDVGSYWLEPALSRSPPENVHVDGNVNVPVVVDAV